MILYVDGLLIVGAHLDSIEALKGILSAKFKMTDSLEVKSFLGMDIERYKEKRQLHINQKTFLKNLLLKFEMSDCIPIATPMECKLNLEKGVEDKRIEKLYR